MTKVDRNLHRTDAERNSKVRPIEFDPNYGIPLATPEELAQLRAEAAAEPDDPEDEFDVGAQRTAIDRT